MWSGTLSRRSVFLYASAIYTAGRMLETGRDKCAYGADGSFSCSVAVVSTTPHVQPIPFLQPLPTVGHASSPTIVEGFVGSGGVASSSASTLDMSATAIQKSKDGIIASDGTRAEAANVGDDPTWNTSRVDVVRAERQAALARVRISNKPQPAHDSVLAPRFI